MQLWIGAGLVWWMQELNEALSQQSLAWWVIWNLISFLLVNCQSRPHLGWCEVVFEKVTSPYRLSPPTSVWKVSEESFPFLLGHEMVSGEKNTISLILLWLVRKFMTNCIIKCGYFKICLNKGWEETSVSTK